MKKTLMISLAMCLLLSFTVRTTAPVKETPTPAPEATIEPADDPICEPTPESSTDKGKVMLAEGFYYIELNDSLKKRITGKSYPPEDKDCLISYEDLRYINVLHYDFDGQIKEGELIVHATLADEVMKIFYELFKAKYPLTSVRLMDDYGGDDHLAMAANCTSAFNYRYVTGSKSLSLHSYGAAIDINPMLNPYVDGDRILPENGIKYADRSLDFTGKIDHDDLCYKLFSKRGWKWGGDWRSCKDYQHFYKDITF